MCGHAQVSACLPACPCLLVVLASGPLRVPQPAATLGLVFALQDVLARLKKKGHDGVGHAVSKVGKTFVGAAKKIGHHGSDVEAA